MSTPLEVAFKKAVIKLARDLPEILKALQDHTNALNRHTHEMPLHRGALDRAPRSRY